MTCITDCFDKEQCCGCGSCVNACPVKAISFDKDEFGFVIPRVDAQKCITCGKCVHSCPYHTSNQLDEKKIKSIAYAAVNKNLDVVKKSSSGGIFFAIAQNVIALKGVVFGAVMDAEFKVRHEFVESCEGLQKLQRSKYVQSFLGDSYSKVKAFLNGGRVVLFSGTPCQIAGLKSFLQNKNYDNLLTVEVVCHGVPNQDFFDDYRKNLELSVGPLKEYVFRYKEKSENGMKWYSSYIANNKRYVRNWPEDSYNYYYMKSSVYRDSCYSCKFAKKERSADITLCDFWHWDEIHKSDFKEKSSISGIVVNSERGLQILKLVESQITLRKSDFDFLSSYNSCLLRPCGKKNERDDILTIWKQNGYAALDAKFKKKCRFQILKYRVLRILPDRFLTFFHKVKHGH